ncbi:UNVERIFIED_CONTAM: drug/metabolite transporter (DMT)-like permease [Brevibacillus sp. OAP136]
MLRSYLLLIFCVTVWGSNFVFGTILVREFSPFFLAAARLLFITLFLLGYALITRRLGRVSRKDWGLLFALGIIGVFLNHWTFYQGLVTADPTTSALILALTPVTTALLAAVFLRERLTRKMIAGSIIATLGVMLVIYNGAALQLSVGLLWIGLTMVTFAISIILVRMLAQRIPPLVTTLYSTLIGFGAMIPVTAINATGWHISGQLWAWGLLILTAVLMHGFVTLIWNSQLQQVGAAKAAMFSNLEPFVAMIFGYFILDKLVTSQQLLGALFIVGGVTLTTLSKEPSATKKQSLELEC